MRILAFDGAGTKGRGQGSVLAHCVDYLGEKLNAPVVFVPTESSLMGVGGTTPWPVASAEAISWAHDYMWNHDGQYILVGFSAGCRPARELLERHPSLKDRVVAVAQLADPWQPANRQQNGIPDSAGHGIMGQALGPIPDRTYWAGHPFDPICRAAPDSLLRYLAASTDAAPGHLFAAFLDKAHRGRLQLAPFLGLPLHEWFFGLGPRIDRSIREAQSYLGSGHTTVYTLPYATPGDTRSLTHRLADTVAWAVR